MTTEKDKLSYSIGYSFGMNLKQTLQRQSIEANPNIVVQTVKFVLIGGDPLITEAEMNDVIMAFQTKRTAGAQRQAVQDKNS